MSTRPIVALTMYPPNDEGRVALPVEYAEAVRRAGALAVLIPPGEPDIADLLTSVDALVLTGGGDLDPESTGGRTHPTVYGTSRARDELELTLAREAVDRDLPTLAICRGLQILNVALGGTLHLHLPDVVDGSVTHRTDPPGPLPHPVQVDAGSLIGRVMGTDQVDTMSWHHQGIDRLGDGLRAVGWAPDGTIEAVELDGHRFLEAVQWHPEITAATDPTQQALFDALVANVRRDP